MNTENTYIPVNQTRERNIRPSKVRQTVVACIKLTAYLAIAASICLLLSKLITKELVIVIGLLLGFSIVSTVLKFALSIIFTIIKWIVVTIALIAIISVI